MIVYRDLTKLPSFPNAVITVGSFDGVHQGHQSILKVMKEEADKIGGETVLITFYPHPRHVVQPKNSIEFLNTFEEKVENLSRYGLQHLVVVPFDDKFAHMLPETYIQSFIWEKFKPKIIILGYDHRFGKDRSGSIDTFKKFQTQYGYQLIEIQAAMVDQIAISSTKIRQAIKAGEMEKAKEGLGYAYGLHGKVVKGRALGRTIGFPTANIELTEPEKLVPPHGVYLVEVAIESHKFGGLMNIGVRPTVSGKDRSIEVYIFDFVKDIYNKDIAVTFLFKLREEQKFDHLDALKEQIHQDKKRAEAYFKDHPIS